MSPLTANGTIFGIPTDNAYAEHVLVAPGQATQLGALSPDGQTVLYASKIEDRGGTNVATYTDVQAGNPLADTLPLIPGTTSCAGCLFDSFTSDGHYALVIDPIDNTEAVDREGPVSVYSLRDGHLVTTFGSLIYTAIGLGDDRFAFIDAVRSDTLITGWSYGMTLRAIDDASPNVVARNAEDFAFDRDRNNVVLSFDGTDAYAGLWVVPLH